MALVWRRPQGSFFLVGVTDENPQRRGARTPALARYRVAARSVLEALVSVWPGRAAPDRRLLTSQIVLACSAFLFSAGLNQDRDGKASGRRALNYFFLPQRPSAAVLARAVFSSGVSFDHQVCMTFRLMSAKFSAPSDPSAFREGDFCFFREAE